MKNREAFFALVRVGLWEDIKVNGYRLEVKDLPIAIDYDEVLRLAEEQSVLGLLAAGVEKLQSGILPLTEKLTLLGKCQMIEQRNLEMNDFVADVVQRMYEEGIDVVLLKGQGVAQCYDKPLWRTCGDVDLFLSEDNYEKAKQYLQPLASHIDKEGDYSKHLGMTINSWTVELHGYLRCGLSKRIDQVLDEIRQDVFSGGHVRSWQNGNTQIFLPSADNDAVYIFTHILNHFYKGGIGLRQICDWCRLLWTYRNEIDVTKLDKRLRKMGLVTEWKAFGIFAVERLGMPVEAMPLYDASNRWKRKAQRIEEFIMMSGNFGHNRDSSYWTKYPYLIRKAFSMKRRVGDLIRHARIFPLDSLRFMPSIVGHGLRSAARGE